MGPKIDRSDPKNPSRSRGQSSVCSQPSEGSNPSNESREPLDRCLATRSIEAATPTLIISHHSTHVLPCIKCQPLWLASLALPGVGSQSPLGLTFYRVSRVDRSVSSCGFPNVVSSGTTRTHVLPCVERRTISQLLGRPKVCSHSPPELTFYRVSSARLSSQLRGQQESRWRTAESCLFIADRARCVPARPVGCSRKRRVSACSR